MKCKTCGKSSRTEFCSILCAEKSKPAKSNTNKALEKLRIKTEQEVIIKLFREQTGFSFCTEYQFDQNRKWRFDYALPEKKIAVEIEGGVWVKGRHTRGKGYIGDMEKYNTAQLLGWRVLRFTPSQIEEMLEAVKNVCADNLWCGVVRRNLNV